MLLSSAALADCPPYPQFATLVGPGIKNPYAKTHGDGEHAVTTYQIRIDTGTLDRQVSHLSYIPDAAMAIGVDSSFSTTVRVVLRIDEDADASIDAAYEVEAGYFAAKRFKEGFPDLLAAAYASGDTVAYLERVLVEDYDARRLDPHSEQMRFEQQVREAAARVCR